ncbi:class I SAM-dependent methyltransferase [Nocardioides bruguierae]|uniref:class I SAM-dependent methyltransferase n=1 Tax=Nocardioides bruguierae TaxID=2945102 RepID=UPI00202254C8|nr:class I SAM-dependent methyltransferase [Nocardioides bruguierae]MCL8027470.1 class I SAM-dependent methyltransferase [Nocardioides bruguierae]
MSEHQPHGRSFGSVAAAYDRGRPGYPPESAAWLTGERPCRVLELGAGTGKLTAALLDLGHQVTATDPDPAMLEILSQRLPDVPVEVASAESLPFAAGSFDVVVAAQAFHWFDAATALPEIVRVLAPAGRLAVVWNSFDARVPWVRRLSRMIGEQDQRADLADEILGSPLLEQHEDAEHRHWHVVDSHSIADMTASRSNVAAMPEEQREQVLADVAELYDGYGRGMDGMQLPLVARCWAAQAAPRPEPSPEEVEREARLEAERAAQLRAEQGWSGHEWDDEQPFDDPSARTGEQAVVDEDDDRMVITTGSLPRIQVSLGEAPLAVFEDEGLLLIDLH